MHMRISVILAHPEKGSFNHAIAAVTVQVLCADGHTVTFHDLYAELTTALREMRPRSSA
jgi:putative NADPH-quinone reductase